MTAPSDSDYGARCAVRVLCSATVSSPAVVALVPPTILLPAALVTGLTTAELQALLLHELAHIRRHDGWVNLLQAVVESLLFYHPAVWWISRAIRAERENCCDDVAGAALGNRFDYARALTAVFAYASGTPAAGGAAVAGTGGSLVPRIQRLLLPSPSRDLAACRALVGLLVLAGALLAAAFASYGSARSAQADGGAQPAEARGADASPFAETEGGRTDEAQSPDASRPRTAAAAPVAGSIRGMVYAADGSPAAGAVVWAAQVCSGPLQRREVVADAAGRYVLDVPPGKWSVWARRGTQGGEGPARHESIGVVAGGAPESVSIRLDERGAFRGRLLEAESGKPVAGGQLFLDVGLVLTTDVAGRFQTGGLYRGEHESFVVAPGRMRLRVLFDTTARADTALEVSVPRAARIVGRVTDLEGKPLAGAYVGRHTSGTFFSTNALFVACDAEGRFEYDDAAPLDQATRLAAAAPGYVEDEHDGLIVPPNGQPLEVHFRLRRQPSDRPDRQAPRHEEQRVVSGVVRGPDGKPVADVMVRWGHQPFVGAIQAQTDAAGRFRLTVPDQANLLAVLPHNFTPAFLPVAAGGDQTIAVAVHAGQTVRGHVGDETGRGIGDVRVVAVIPSPEPGVCNPHWLSESAVRTDGAGNFELRGVPDGARFDFTKPGLSDVRNHHLALSGADNTVRMQYGGAIQGRALDRHGKPLRNFRVLVNIPRERGSNEQAGGFFAGYCGTGVRFTSDDGTFVLTGLVAGCVHRVTVLAEGHGEATLDRVTAVPANHLGSTEPVTFQAGPPGALRVRTVAVGGSPIANARVTLVNGDLELDRSFTWGYHDASWEDMVRRRSASDGWASFPTLSFNGATILVEAPGRARQRMGWRNGQKELTVELPPESVLTGTVREAAGGPVKAFYVQLLSGGNQISASAEPEDNGRFRIAELPAGKATVIVHAEDGRGNVAQEEVLLQAGEAKDLTIVAKKQ